MRLAIAATVAALMAACSSTQTNTEPLAGPPTPHASPAQAGVVRDGVTERLTQHVWAIPDGNAPLVPNVGIIVGRSAVLVVDPGMGRKNGEAVLKETQRLAPGRQIWIVSTHFHPEHDMGAIAFPADAKMIRARAQLKDIEESGMTLANTFRQRGPEIAAMLEGVYYREADLVFDREHSLDLGGVKVKLLEMGLNHTRGDTAIFVEGDGVLFSGDVAMRLQPSVMHADAKVSQWLASQDRLEALKPLHVVPAHGLRGDAGIISGYRVYFTKVRDRAKALKTQGQTQEQAVETIASEMTAEIERMTGRALDRARLTGAVRAAWAEV